MDHVIPLHLGDLHPYEQALTLILAFGPFVVLALVIWLRQRESAVDDSDERVARGARPVRGSGEHRDADT